MEIHFKDKKIRALCEERTVAEKKLGAACAGKLRVRLNALTAAQRVTDLIMGNPHPLKGDRAGQFALDLAGVWYSPRPTSLARTDSTARLTGLPSPSFVLNTLEIIMTDLNAPFAPDWVSPPGETLLDLLEERNWTQAELAQRLGYTEKHVSQLLNGKVPLSMDAALRLARVVGSTADFWLALETNYQKHKAQLEAEAIPGTVCAGVGVLVRGNICRVVVRDK